jgi:glycosyltransferase involved in cell wall biosynthesis
LADNKEIIQELRRLKIAEFVQLVGFVPTQELVKLYKNATAVIVPTLFESASFPIWEAFRLKIPVICSSVTALPDQAAGAAFFFDPYSPVDMAVVSLDSSLTEKVRTGFDRVNQFTGTNTALGYRFSYRRAAKLPLDGQDQNWINSGVRF